MERREYRRLRRLWARLTKTERRAHNGRRPERGAGPALTLSGSLLRGLRGPIVYALALDGLPQYVGSSRAGLLRPFHSQHARLGLVEWNRHHRLYVWPVPTEAEARRLEQAMIRALHPVWNLTGTGRRAPEGYWPPVRGWERSAWAGPHDHICACGELVPCDDRTCQRMPAEIQCPRCELQERVRSAQPIATLSADLIEELRARANEFTDRRHERGAP